MRNELELMELVDRYLEGAMDATERAAFEQRLNTEPQLNAMLLDQRSLREGLERIALRPAVTKAYQAHRFGKWKPWLGGASIVIIAAAGWTLWDRMPREAHEVPTIEQLDQLPVDPSSVAPADTTQRTIRYEVDTIIDTVYRVLENGKWRTVKERPAGSQVLADSISSQSDADAPTSSPSATRTPLPVRMEPVETKPTFPGGMGAFYTFLEANIKHPDLAKPVSGTVEVGFTISASGQVENAEIVKGLDPGYNAEALRVIRSMPRWKPGEQDGKPVPCRLQMPMQFRNPGWTRRQA
ncbi:MAG: energy transducer TonB [Flavobacteriales bacterium]|nr:energy transducer TonB [Flavobacteriales bacterium]